MTIENSKMNEYEIEREFVKLKIPDAFLKIKA